VYTILGQTSGGSTHTKTKIPVNIIYVLQPFAAAHYLLLRGVSSTALCLLEADCRTKRHKHNLSKGPLPLHTRHRVIEAVLNEILGLPNKPKAAVHSVHKLTGPKKKKMFCNHLISEEQSNNRLTCILLIFICGDTFKPQMYSTLVENEELHQHIFYACQTIHNHPGSPESRPDQTCPY